MAKVKKVCRNMDTNQPLDILLIQLDRILRGWCVYFRPGVSSKTFGYLAHYTWWQVVKWLQRKHRRIGWRRLLHRYFSHGWWPTTSSRRLFNPGEMRTTRYRYRGAAIPSPWPRAG
jgi:RNA-directed DNA polymerase